MNRRLYDGGRSTHTRQALRTGTSCHGWAAWPARRRRRLSSSSTSFLSLRRGGEGGRQSVGGDDARVARRRRRRRTRNSRRRRRASRALRLQRPGRGAATSVRSTSTRRTRTQHRSAQHVMIPYTLESRASGHAREQRHAGDVAVHRVGSDAVRRAVLGLCAAAKRGADWGQGDFLTLAKGLSLTGPFLLAAVALRRGDRRAACMSRPRWASRSCC